MWTILYGDILEMTFVRNVWSTFPLCNNLCLLGERFILIEVRRTSRKGGDVLSPEIF